MDSEVQEDSWINSLGDLISRCLPDGCKVASFTYGHKMDMDYISMQMVITNEHNKKFHPDFIELFSNGAKMHKATGDLYIQSTLNRYKLVAELSRIAQENADQQVYEWFENVGK